VRRAAADLADDCSGRQSYGWGRLSPLALGADEPGESVV
jgi:hypothetical protein